MKSFPRSSWTAAFTLILLAAASCGGDEPATATAGGASATETTEATEPTETTEATETTEPTGTTEATDGGDGHDHAHEHDHGDAGAATRYDADLADADQTISVNVVDGGPEGGVARVAVDRGSVVALRVTSDTAEEVHVHGYDILRAVSGGHPAHFAFTAEIPGVFEVELEGSGRLLLQLEIS